MSKDTVDLAQVPEEVQTEIPKSTDEPVKQVAEEVLTEQPTSQTNATTEKKMADVEASWDADEVEVKKETPKSDFNFSELGSALELGEIKSKEEFITKTSEIKSKLKALEEAPLAGLDDEAKEVIKVMKSGGNWKDYLSSNLIDYTKVDPVQLFGDTFLDNATRIPKYFTDGKFDPAKAEEALEALQESYKEYEGMRIAQSLNGIQKQRQAEHRAKAEAKLVHAEKTLSAATQNLKELLPVESYGIKFEPKHSAEMYQGITSSKLTKQYLGVNYETLVAQGFDMAGLTATIASRHYLEKMIKHKSQNSKAEAKKEILALTQNAQIKNTGSVVVPEDTDKKATPAELIRQHRQNQNKGL
jgi:hypothetical protein